MAELAKDKEMDMKLSILLSLTLFTNLSWAINCEILPYHKTGAKKQIEIKKIAGQVFFSEGECISWAKSYIGKKINDTVKVSSVDFVIQGDNETIKGTIITPKMP